MCCVARGIFRGQYRLEIYWPLDADFRSEILKALLGIGDFGAEQCHHRGDRIDRNARIHDLAAFMAVTATEFEREARKRGRQHSEIDQILREYSDRIGVVDRVATKIWNGIGPSVG